VLAAVLALIVCGIAPAGAEPPSVARADVLWAGLYEADVGGTISQPDTAAGRTNELFNTRKVRATTIVECCRSVVMTSDVFVTRSSVCTLRSSFTSLCNFTRSKFMRIKIINVRIG